MKLRGQRVELGEIERVLQRPPVEACAVLLVQPGILVAVVSLAHSDIADSESMLEDCRRSLPPTMVPQAVHILNSSQWPRTSSGKVDRRALAASITVWLGQRQGLGASTCQCVGHQCIEEALSNVLREVTGIAPTSPTHRLESLGLTSLSAVRVASIARARGIHVSVLHLLSPDVSVARLAEEAAGLSAEPAETAIREILVEVLSLLLGGDDIAWKSLAQTSRDETWKVLLCPGDGGAGVDGYRPLSQSLLEALWQRFPQCHSSAVSNACLPLLAGSSRVFGRCCRWPAQRSSTGSRAEAKCR